MLNFITHTVRYILTLYFGVFVTTSIIGIKNNKKKYIDIKHILRHRSAFGSRTHML